MPHVPRANAALTPCARLRLARLSFDHSWPPARAAERYDAPWCTAKKWLAAIATSAGRDVRTVLVPTPAAEPGKGVGGAQARASAVKAAARAGRDRRPARHGFLDCARVLVRCRIDRLSHVDWATGEQIHLTSTRRQAV